MTRISILFGALLGSTVVIGWSMAGAWAADDKYMTDAKAYIDKVTAPVTTWDGPTTGPKAQGKRLIVYASADQRNGGASGVGDGAQEAAKALGWDFRILDGQGSVPGRTSALTQAIALKPDGIILGTIDAAEQAPIIEQAIAAGIKVVGWHSGGAPGKIDAVPGVFTNITTDPNEVAKSSGLYAVVDSGGTAGVILFTDSIYAIATAKTNAEKTAVEGCSGCKVLEVIDTPIGDLANRMGQLTTSLLAKYGKAWTYSIGVNDLYFDFSAPSLQSAGIDPATGYPRQIAAGDGSVPAFQRIRQQQYQIATVAEPLHLHGWETIDEMNRALAGAPPSGYVAPPHLFIKANIDNDGGDQNTFDPGNGFREQYKKIWGVQ
jgi:ribose transport system substrate-binding protein